MRGGLTGGFCGAVVLLLALLGGRMSFAAGALRSPWDRAAPRAEGAFTCPVPPDLPRDLSTESYYADAAHSIVDPARHARYVAQTRALSQAARRLARMADGYRQGGDPGMARCVAHWLAAFARGSVLAGRIRGHQSLYVQDWMLGAFAINWLKIRAAPSVAAESRRAVLPWFVALSRPVQQADAAHPGRVDARNNHRYWAGMAVMAAGIAADRRDLYDWGLGSFQIAMAQITPEGTLPLEMARRGRALHYHLFAAEPLVEMAEFAAANGQDLYQGKDGALMRLVRHAAAGLVSPDLFTREAGVAQEAEPLSAERILWAAPAVRRFPDPRIAGLLAQVRPKGVLYLGGLPPP